METHAIAVFDVCGTITRTNNTCAFVGYVLRTDRSVRYGLLLLLRILAGLFRLLGIRSLFRRDLLREGQIGLLRGYSRARIRELSERYVDHLFTQGLLHPRVLDALKQEKDQGKAVFLVSSALDPPVAEIAKRLGVEGCFSSELETQDGHYTGRLKTDLLGHKQSVLTRMPADVNWQASCVYSDNREDAEFMESFGKRNVILNAPEAAGGWDTGKEGRDFLVNYDPRKANQDVDSVNERTVKWVYVPLLYYLISRFHRAGLFSLLLREIVPVTFTGYLVANPGARALVLMPLSFLMFYSIYEIGGLVNDSSAGREASGKGTRRLAPHVRIHAGLFVSIRLVLVGLLLVWLSARTYPVLLYAAALGFCLAVYLVHNRVMSHLRVLTFLLLKLCRNSVPLVLLASHIPAGTVVYLCTIFFVLDAPGRVYLYGRRRGLINAQVPVWRVRCATAALLCGLGAALYLAHGSIHLLAIASYYVVLECLWVLYGSWSRELAWSFGQNS